MTFKWKEFNQRYGSRRGGKSSRKRVASATFAFLCARLSPGKTSPTFKLFVRKIELFNYSFAQSEQGQNIVYSNRAEI